MQQLRRKLPALAVMFLACVMLFIECSRTGEVEKKQIILISIDTLRNDHISPYGYSRDTSPTLTKLVEDSVYYTHAYTNGCWTHPSHMSLLTGTLPSRHGINKPLGTIKNKKYQKLNEALHNIPQVLKTQGTKTIKFAKLPNELGFGNGFDINNVIDPFAAEYAFKWLLQELENHQEKDFFLFIHTWKVHAPYFSSRYMDKERLSEEVLFYMKHPYKLPNGDYAVTIRQRQFLKKNNLLNVQDCVDMYDGGIYYVDGYIGRLIDRLKSLGIYNDLMFIVVSDHGEHFAEHDPLQFYNWHGKDYYEEFVRVPIIIKYPQRTVKPGRRAEPVSLIDVFPTILDFYEIEIPAFVQGDSLLKPEGRRKKHIVSEAVSQDNQELKMIREGTLKYIVTMQNPSRMDRVNWDEVKDRRLFDLKNDPLEKRNLYGDVNYKEHSFRLEKMLKEILTESSSANRTTDEVTLDQETMEQMEALGYF